MSRWALKRSYRVHPPGQTAGMVMAASGVQTSATCKMIASSQGTERRFKSHSVSCGPSLTSDLNFINSSSDERDSKISLIIFSRSEYLKLHRFFILLNIPSNRKASMELLKQSSSHLTTEIIYITQVAMQIVLWQIKYTDDRNPSKWKAAVAQTFVSFHIGSKWAKYHHHWNCAADETSLHNKLNRKNIQVLNPYLETFSTAFLPKHLVEVPKGEVGPLIKKKKQGLLLVPLRTCMFDQGFGDKLPCDTCRPGVWWVLTHFILSNSQKCLTLWNQ